MRTTSLKQVGVIQRALQMAREGKFKTASEIQTALIHEDYDFVPQFLSGQSIRRQLKATIKASV